MGVCFFHDEHAAVVDAALCDDVVACFLVEVCGVGGVFLCKEGEFGAVGEMCFDGF